MKVHYIELSVILTMNFPLGKWGSTPDGVR